MVVNWISLGGTDMVRRHFLMFVHQTRVIFPSGLKMQLLLIFFCKCLGFFFFFLYSKVKISGIERVVYLFIISCLL